MLFGNALAHSIYSTYEITLHDGDQLIACGFFDLGATGAQGISSFYDPSYKKYSLGKYLIYLKMQYCKELGLQYFYPGYFVPGNSHFDYKLTIGRAALQFFRLSTQSWEPIPMFSAGDIPCEVMRQKLLNVHSILAQANKSSRILKYNFFDRYLIPELRDTGLLDFPLLLYFGLDDDATDPILVFDVRDGHYHLLSCVPAWKPIDPNPDTDFYSAYFLMPTAVVQTSDSAEEVAALILKQINSD